MSKPGKPAKEAWAESRPVNMRLPPSMYEELAAYAEEQGRPFANMVKFALQEWLDLKRKKGGK